MDTLTEVTTLIKKANEGITDDSSTNDYALAKILRETLSDEHRAIAGYYKAADLSKKLGHRKLQKLFNSLAEEEVVHVGELNKALQFLNLDEPELEKSGEEEAEQELKGDVDDKITRRTK